MSTAATQPASGITRRSLLWKAALAAAVAVGAGAALRNRFLGRERAGAPILVLDDDSIFMPRADQRDKVLGRR